mgnify:CR=1 FL=1
MDVFDLCTEVERPKPNVLQRLARREPGPRVFEVVPGIMYPAMVRHVVANLKKDPPNDGLRRYYAMAKRIQGKAGYAWESALVSRERCSSDVQVRYRAEALETCRLWFTKMLHQAVNEVPMVVHILGDDRYRL